MIGIDMKMPKACMCCDLEYWAYGFGNRCAATFAETTYNREKSRHPDCPLRPLDDEIRVGDEVENISASGNCIGKVCVVTEIHGDSMHGLLSNGDFVICSSQLNKWWRKTGRHFDEIEALLQKMRGENDG